MSDIVDEIGLKYLRENTNLVIGRVKKGESFLVRRRSDKLFKIVPVDSLSSDDDFFVDLTEDSPSGMDVDELIKLVKDFK